MKASSKERNNVFKRNDESVKFDSYEIQRDHHYGGFKIKLNWTKVPNTIFYKIYKATLPKSTLDKNFEIDQKAFEFLTRASILGGARSNILYNKENFVANKNVNLINTSSRFDDVRKSYKFSEIAQISNSNSSSFTFYDKNVKFGKAYAYIVTATNTSIQESRRDNQIIVNVQDLESPSEPSIFSAVDMPAGINFSIGNKKDSDVQYFDLYRRNKEIDSKYEIVKRIEVKNGLANYLDRDIFPGNEYDYKVFSVDFYKNLSLNSSKLTKGFNQIFINDATIPYPELEIIKDSKFLKFKVKQNHSKLLGFTIQRKDIWNHEKDFSYKSYSNSIWPQVVLFKDGEAEFQDLNLESDKNYQYRIFTVLKNQRPGAYYTSPIINLKDFEKLSIHQNLNQKNEPYKFLNYQLNIIDNKQNPVFLNIKVNTKGHFTHFTVSLNNTTQIIDAINSDVFLKVLQDTNYLLTLKFYDENKLLNSIDNIKFSTK